MNDPEWKSWAEDPDKLLVLLAGQSNIAGRGYAGPDDLEPVPRLLMIRPDHQWQPAVAPVTKDRPFIAGDMASFYPKRVADHIPIVDDALKLLAGKDARIRLVTTKDLTHRGDKLHFDTESLHKLGARYFEAYLGCL